MDTARQNVKEGYADLFQRNVEIFTVSYFTENEGVMNDSLSEMISTYQILNKEAQIKYSQTLKSNLGIMQRFYEAKRTPDKFTQYANVASDLNLTD